MTTSAKKRASRRASPVRATTPNQQVIAGLQQDIQSRDGALRAANAALVQKAADIKTLESLVTEQRGRLQANATTAMGQNDRVNALKAILSRTERQLAESQGYARALQERVEHDSPFVEIPQQPVTITKAEAIRFNKERNGGHRDLHPIRDDLHTGYDATTSSKPSKHWTAI